MQYFGTLLLLMLITASGCLQRHNYSSSSGQMETDMTRRREGIEKEFNSETGSFGACEELNLLLF